MGGGPSTPIEQVTELGEGVMEKLIAAGITTVESLADMTAEELSEIQGIGEKTVEKIAVAVRHYFGQYEEGEERPPAAQASAVAEPVLHPGEEAIVASLASDQKGDPMRSMTSTPEQILAQQAGDAGLAREVSDFSTEDIAAAEDQMSEVDANDANDAREADIEMENEIVDQLVNQTQEVSEEGPDEGEHTRE
jgi:N utilization substance protein A